jgi:malate dehydrogenase
MSRDDLLVKNAEIVRNVTKTIVRYSPNAILIVVSNPLDEMAYVAYRASGFDRSRVIGMSGVLDSSRLRSFIASELQVAVEDVSAVVIGGQGEGMVPLSSYATVSGIPLSQLLPQERIQSLLRRTREAGGEIVNHLKTSSAYYAPAASLTAMIEAISRDKRRILPCAVYLDGEYGLNDIVLGVPVKLGRNGMEGVIEINLLDEEYQALQRSAGLVRENLAKI